MEEGCWGPQWRHCSAVVMTRMVNIGVNNDVTFIHKATGGSKTTEMAEVMTTRELNSSATYTHSELSIICTSSFGFIPPNVIDLTDCMVPLKLSR